MYMNVSRRFHIKHETTTQRQFQIEPEIGAKRRRLNRSEQVLMVFSGEKRGGGGSQTAEEEDMKRLKPLHNFNLPYLKWGNQKLLRCMKVDSSGDVSVINRNQSSDRGGSDDFVTETWRRDSEFEKWFGTSDYHKFSSSGRIDVAGDGEIEATREMILER